jgi:hypothetical protein
MLPALLIVALLVQPLSQPLSPRRGEARQPQQTQSRSAKQPASADQRGTEKFPLVIKQVPTPKTDAEAAQEAKDRKEKTANERELVRFTGWLVVATLILAVVGFFQLFVFGDQARQLRKTVKAAAEQSEAMERSIAEATRLASAMEVVAKEIAVSSKAALASVSAIGKQMRAYLCVVIGTAIYQDRAKHLKFQAIPSIVNAGLTPAHKVSFIASAAILSIPLPEDFAFPLADKPSGESVIGPRQDITVGPIVPDFCDDADIEGIKRGDQGRGLYAWGTFTYEDIFGDAHYTKFCHMYTWRPDDKTWGYYQGRHNEAN